MNLREMSSARKELDKEKGGGNYVIIISKKIKITSKLNQIFGNRKPYIS